MEEETRNLLIEGFAGLNRITVQGEYLDELCIWKVGGVLRACLTAFPDHPFTLDAEMDPRAYDWALAQADEED